MVKKYFSDLKNEFKGYNLSKLIKDLLSGVTVAAVALPLALAFGVSSGATPAAGLVTAIIGGIVIGLLSGASFQISGPTGAMSAILITVVANYGLNGMFVASFFAGIIILLAGIFKLGKLVSFLPSSVVMGFTSGIAIIIAMGQIDNFFGTVSEGTGAIEKIASYFRIGFSPSWQAVLIGAIVVVFMLLWPKKLNEKVPGSLLAIVIATVISTLCGFKDLAVVGDIPKSLLLSDSLKLSGINFEMVSGLISPIISVAALGMIESLLCGVSASRMKNEEFDANRELVAQGIGNILLPFFGGVPATAAIARTSVAIKSGEQTRLSGIFHALFLLASMMLLGGVMARLPLSALAGVLMVTAWRMNEWHGIKHIFKNKIYSAIIQFLATMIATVIFDLTIAIVIGIAVAALQFIVSASRVSIETTNVHRTLEKYESGDDNREVLISYISGALFFGNTDTLLKYYKDLNVEGCRHIILSLRGVPSVDVSGSAALLEICELLKAKDIDVRICGVNDRIRKNLDKSGVTAAIGEQGYSATSSDAVLDVVHKGI
ncbi:MAG: SulP family inorganic anion transporter [Clostridia bacterium]|nr:SulP family inorganic anion transporter [Clostridia bacterium]